MKIIDGINGAPTSIFYNLETATAITGKGRELISVATAAFDAFLGQHLIFLNITECCIYIKNIIKEKYNLDTTILKNISKYELQNLLLSYFDSYDSNDELVLSKLIKNLTQEQVNKIYYKNNLYEFCRIPEIKNMIYDFTTCVDTYVNPEPDKTPEHLKEKLDKFWTYLKTFVFYDYQYIDRIYKVINKPRRAVLVIDTDS